MSDFRRETCFRKWVVTLLLASQSLNSLAIAQTGSSSTQIVPHTDRALTTLPDSVSSSLTESMQADLSSGTARVITAKDQDFRQIPWKTLSDFRSAFPSMDIPVNKSGLVLITLLLQQVRADSTDSEDQLGIINLPIAIIFAREILEAAVIYTNFHSVVDRADLTPVEKSSYRRTINWSAAGGITLGVVAASAIGLTTKFLGGELEDRYMEIAEGVSKLIASFFVANISLNLPKWINPKPVLFTEAPGATAPRTSEIISKKMVAGNIIWNFAREVGEIGVFLVPSILAGQTAEEISASAAVGSAVALGAGAGLYFGGKFLNKKYLSIASATLTGLLATGLFSGALHEFEEASGEETPDAYDLGPDMSHKNLPLALIHPFGYSGNPTILETVSWWTFAAGLTGFHILKQYHPESLASSFYQKCRGWICGTSSAETSLPIDSSVPTDKTLPTETTVPTETIEIREHPSAAGVGLH